MKKIAAIFLALSVMFSLCACGHEHSWTEASCTEPKTCSECGATEGDALGHDWKEATCTEPKTCSRCGATEGEALGHSWIDVTCTEPKTCSRCGATEGEALGHSWIDATCTEAKTCSICGATEGEPLGHSCEKWTVVNKSTCTEKGSETGVCTVCGETVTRDTAYAEHTPGDWEIKIKATVTTEGLKVKKCTVCGEELETESYQLEPFDISKIKNRSNFIYDEFNKSWKYYAYYDEKYSDATESIILILFSEDNGTNIEDVEIRATLDWKDASETPWIAESLEFLINETIYHFDMTKMDSNDVSYSFLYNDISYSFIQSLANTSQIKIKINYDNNRSTTLDLRSNPFRAICKDIVDYNMWDYYIPNSYIESLDTTSIR